MAVIVSLHQAACCLCAGPSGSLTPPASSMAAPSTPRSQTLPSTSAALPAALKTQHPATTSQVSSCPVSVSDPHTGEVQLCLLHTQSKQWQGVLLTSQAWSSRLPGFASLHSAPSSCFHRLAAKLAILTMPHNCNKCTDANCGGPSRKFLCKDNQSTIAACNDSTVQLHEYTSDRKYHTGNGRQHAHIYHCNASQPLVSQSSSSQRTAASTETSSHRYRILSPVLLLCCLHAVVVNTTFQYYFELL